MPQVQLSIRVLAVVGAVVVVGAALVLWLAHTAPRPDHPAPLESEVVHQGGRPPRENDPAGSRTRDLRIKSPLLYQLSYRVGEADRGEVRLDPECSWGVVREGSDLGRA